MAGKVWGTQGRIGGSRYISSGGRLGLEGQDGEAVGYQTFSGHVDQWSGRIGACRPGMGAATSHQTSIGTRSVEGDQVTQTNMGGTVQEFEGKDLGGSHAHQYPNSLSYLLGSLGPLNWPGKR